jgi:hypothetical protein
VEPKLFFSDPDPTFQKISDPDPITDPTLIIMEEAKEKFKKNLELIFLKI